MISLHKFFHKLEDVPYENPHLVVVVHLVVVTLENFLDAIFELEVGVEVVVLVMELVVDDIVVDNLVNLCV
jgi:hypothetical protein